MRWKREKSSAVGIAGRLEFHFVRRDNRLIVDHFISSDVEKCTCAPSAMDGQPVCEHWSWFSPLAIFATLHWHSHLWEIPVAKEKTHFYIVSQHGDTLCWSAAQFGSLDEISYQRLINSMDHPQSFNCWDLKPLCSPKSFRVLKYGVRLKYKRLCPAWRKWKT